MVFNGSCACWLLFSIGVAVIYKFEAVVINVEEKFRTLRARKTASGEIEQDVESLGWFVRIAQSAAIGVGVDKPDILPGDKVQITMAKI